MIDLIDVTAGYRNRPIIKNFSLRLERGNFVVLIGPNGAGKSRCCGLWQAFCRSTAERAILTERIMNVIHGVFFPSA